MAAALRLPAPAAQVARLCGGRLLGRGARSARITGFATLDTAGPDELAFLGQDRYLAKLKQTQAGVVLVNKRHRGARTGPLIVVDGDARASFMQLLNAAGAGRKFAAGVASSATVARSAKLGRGVHIGAGAVIGARARIGAGTRILARAVVTEDCEVGADCLLHEGCVIGAEGFGLINGPAGPERIAHRGRVVLGDRVEVGANSCIDRGLLEDTVVGAGCKIDNLVQVGHNVTLGERCVVCGCVAIGGSARIGSDCVIGGGSRIKDHCVIVNKVSLMAATTVIGDIRKEGVYGNVVPQLPQRELKRVWREWYRQGKG